MSIQLSVSVNIKFFWRNKLIFAFLIKGLNERGITHCIRNEEVVSQQCVVQQRGNDTLQSHWAPVRLQGGHPHKERLVAGPEARNH